MPGMMTHDVFGALTLQEDFPEAIAQSCTLFPAAWHLGHQGPDLFFYDPASWLKFPANPGNIMHRFRTGTLIMALLEERNRLADEGEKRIADAYICGYMGHYTLDAACHPYVFWRIRHLAHANIPEAKDFGMHVFLETDMDNACVRHYTGLEGIDYGVDKNLAASLTERRVIARLLSAALGRVFSEYADEDPEAEKIRAVSKLCPKDAFSAMGMIVLTARLLKSPKGRTKFFVRRMEQTFLGFPVVSGMLSAPGFVRYPDACNEAHHVWRNPWDPRQEARTESVYDLMEQASLTHRRRCRLYAEATALSDASSVVPPDETLLEACQKAFEIFREDLGELSYNSGYSVTIHHLQ